MIGILLTLAQASTPQGTTSNTALIIVAIIGASSGIFGAYFAYRAQKKQADTSLETEDKASILKEREQLSVEWKALREFQGIQLQAARREIETLEHQVAVLKTVVEGKDAQLDEKNIIIFDLQRSYDQCMRDLKDRSRELRSVPPVADTKTE